MSTMTISERDLARIEACCATASPAPWDPIEFSEDGRLRRGIQNGGGVGWIGDIVHQEDAAFIAQARTDLPALVAAVREAKEALEPLEALHRAMAEVEARHGHLADSDPVWSFNDVKLLRGDLRRAARVLEGKG
jgi:hypothetical protein